MRLHYFFHDNNNFHWAKNPSDDNMFGGAQKLKNLNIGEELSVKNQVLNLTTYGMVAAVRHVATFFWIIWKKKNVALVDTSWKFLKMRWEQNVWKRLGISKF